MRPRAIALTILTIVLVVLSGLGGQFSSGRQRSLGEEQDLIRKQPACTIFCGDGTFNTISLGAKPCWGGPLPASEAGDHFKSLSAEDQNTICQNLKTAGKRPKECPAFKTLAALCKGDKLPEKEKPKCEEQKTPPWFDTGAKCDGMWSGIVPSARAEPGLGYVICRISYIVCGFPGFEEREERFSMGLLKSYSRMTQKEAEKFCESKGYGANTVPGRSVCCKKFDQAYTDWIAFRRKNGPDAPGQPCNPGFDADCDGIPNEKDATPIGDCATYPGRPSPSPTQTPPAPTFRPTSSRSFGSELFHKPKHRPGWPVAAEAFLASGS